MDSAALPLFPLHTVLFPGGLLPLQIFEVRYLDLMNRCDQSGEPFGVVCLQSGQEVRRAPQAGEAKTPAETFATVGTLARLERMERPQAGLMFVQARGGQRFKLKQTKVMPHGLWMGDVEWLPDDLSVALPQELTPMSERLQRVLQSVAEDASQMPPPPSDHCWQDAGWVANRWAELLPLPAQERQRLMSLDNPLWRLELATEWLERLERMAQPAGRNPH
jgi:Lon protease-like protein